uniref:Uncharacterized protein n=1 Tax=Rhizophora mucronata TaxID=61149 RepID=A0A2P2Q1M8_RHIMU
MPLLEVSFCYALPKLYLMVKKEMYRMFKNWRFINQIKTH